jgi:hypothetical protein
MSGEVLDDYGQPLDMGTNNSNVSTVSTPDLRYLINDDNAPVGNTSNNYVMPGSYTGTGLTNTFEPSNALLSTVKSLFTDKNGNLNMQALGAVGGGLAGLLGAMNKSTTPTGYQGGIPLLGATRTMLTAPPTTNPDGTPRRPGQSGINYGGDVTYSRLAKETDPWVNLDGTNNSGVQVPGGVQSNAPVGGVKAAAPVGSEGYRNYIAGGGTPEGYLKVINDYINANPNMTEAQLRAKMAEFRVSDTDLQTALGASGFSNADKYALTHGTGLNSVNQSINNWLATFPDATPKQIEDAKKVAAEKWGITQEDIDDAMALPEQNKAAAVAAGLKPATEENIYDLFKGGASASTVANAVASSGLSTADLAKEFNLKPEDLTYLRGQGYLPAGYAEGGEIVMAKGRYLQGATDGMADELPAQIGEDQPAALSHGEFVVPADVVSHLGNGNSDAGAKKLYQMMDKIRTARTGTKKQGKKINPDKFMPGGLASAYAKGGTVKHFETGGATGSALNAGLTGSESNLSNWAGPYVTGMLGQGQALANLPYQAYTGPLTAGASPLQTGAFSTAAGLTTPTGIGTAADTAGGIATKAQGLSYTPGTASFDATQASAYMNPYIESALKPQLDEARRQSQITQTQNAAKMTQAGAFGGGRQAILDAETQRNLATTQAGITGKGYETAFDKAMSQFNADQARKAQESQFGATFGLQGLQTGLQGAQAQGQLGLQQNQAGLANLAAQLEAGNTQRGIESEGIAADKAQFEEARSNPYKMVQFQQSLLQGLPLAAQSYNVAQPSTLQQVLSGAGGVASLFPNTGTAGAQDLAAALKKLGIG